MSEGLFQTFDLPLHPPDTQVALYCAGVIPRPAYIGFCRFAFCRRAWLAAIAELANSTSDFSAGYKRALSRRFGISMCDRFQAEREPYLRQMCTQSLEDKRAPHIRYALLPQRTLVTRASRT